MSNTNEAGATPTPPSTVARCPVLAYLHPFARPAVIAAAHLLLFTLARATLFLAYRDDFRSVPGGTIAWGFLLGLRFDAAIIALIIGPPLLLLLLPFRWARHRRWQRVWGWVCFGAFVVFFFVLAADVLYFPYVHRHVGHEVVAVREAFDAVARSAAAQYVLPLLGFVGAVAAAAWGWARLLRGEVPAPPNRWVQIGAVVVLGWLLYSAQRGSFSVRKRLKPIHAFEPGSPHMAAQLALNGPFCVIHSLDHTTSVKSEFYPWTEAVQVAREALFVPGETAPDPQYPLLRSRAKGTTGKPNVVVIMLESWDAFYVDAHRKEMGLSPLGLTPCYDATAREGLLFSRFYACGQKSMEGMAAMLCGIPTLPHLPYLGRGLEQGSLTYLGHLARREGYRTFFIQSSKREAFRNDKVSDMAGFETYLGAEDLPPLPPAVSRAPLGGEAWDQEMFVEANRRLAASPRPFLAFLYTATTHAPFNWPDDRWKRRSGTSVEDRYHNSLAYSDFALGQFFEGAKAAGYFDRTVFILTADHIGGPAGGVRPDDPPSLHRTPCLVIAPGLQAGVDRQIGSQLDVIPTVMDLAGWSGLHACLGTSLFSNPAPGRGAFCVQGDLILRVEEDGWVLHNLNGRVGARAGTGADAIERRLLSISQVTYGLLRTNRLSKE